jgi:hypothetical protein
MWNYVTGQWCPLGEIKEMEKPLEVMFGYTFMFEGVVYSYVHYDQKVCLEHQQYQEYIVGLPCNTYSYAPDDIDSTRFSDVCR